MQTRLLAIIPDPNDATSFYRGIGPLSHLHNLMDISVKYPDRVDYAILANADIVFMQRPCLPEHLQAAEMIKSAGIPLWMDFDDDLYCVPIENPRFFVYNNPQNQEVLKKLPMLADVITVSTETLKQSLITKFGNLNIKVIPNAWDERYSKFFPKVESKPKSILWRGSETHVKDLMMVAKDIIEVVKSDPEIRITFMAYLPWFICEQLPPNQWSVVPPCSIIDYLKALADQRPSLMIVPLADNEFNRSKSNIAWIEGTMAGAAVIAPQFKEWIMPGCVGYKDHFKAILQDWLDDSGEIVIANKQSKDFILNNLTLQIINKHRVDVITDLV